MKTKEQITYNMSRIRNKDTKIEVILRKELWNRGLRYKKNLSNVIGKPDIAFPKQKVAIFCDSEFWHGYNWRKTKNDFKRNREFWTKKIENNINRDKEVNKKLLQNGWEVLRFWGHEIRDKTSECGDLIEKIVEKRRKLFNYRRKYKTLDLFAGIGGIRRGFELTKRFCNVLSAENDKYCCKTYKKLFGEDPFFDASSEAFKKKTEKLDYDVLLAGFPCQSFSNAGKKEGFKDKIRGTLFFDIVDILQRTKPKAFLLENVKGLISHNNGKTFRTILEILTLNLNYHVMGVEVIQESHEKRYIDYKPNDFLINSKFFGIPHNRPRVYIIGFNKNRYGENMNRFLPFKKLPKKSFSAPLFNNLNEVLEFKVEPKYYLSEGYLQTLKKHRNRHESKGNGFGYIVVNRDKEKSVANALLATGGSGKERNLIYDPQPEIYGKIIGNKKSPINNEGIRVMTPKEWGKLQGFIDYGFISKGKNTFEFPKSISETQQYKQFGNAVTIPVVEKLAEIIAINLDYLESLRSK